MAKLFGWELIRSGEKDLHGRSTELKDGPISFVPPDDRDGALNVQFGGGGYYGFALDVDISVVDDFSLINRYREMQLVAEVDEAIDQIINEIVIQDAARMPVSINLDVIEDDIIKEDIKARIRAEFDSILKLMNMHKDAYSIVRQWYVDGRLFYHLIIDDENAKKGIQELRSIDPRCIRKIREVQRKRHPETQAEILEVQREYYTFNPMGFVAPANGSGASITNVGMMQQNGIRITKESIAFVPSGLYDSNKKSVLSWLHKAIKPLNLMRMMEDSCVIYRVSRAPERRVFYVDTGSLPKIKAEQYLNDMMQKYRNKLVYDHTSGEIRDDRKFMSIMEDFWMPRREGGKGTEITTLPGGQNLSEMEDVDYFRRKLYRALNLPPSRIDAGAGFNLGRASEISRDELRFSKFIHRLQTQFTTLFDQILEQQLRLKGVITESEWHTIKDNIRYEWQKDSYFEELKSQEMWTSRLTLLQQAEPYIGRFFPESWINREVLKFTDDEVAAMREEMEESKASLDGIGGDDMSDDEGDAPFGESPDLGDTFDNEADGILNDGGDSPKKKPVGKPKSKGSKTAPPKKKTTKKSED